MARETAQVSILTQTDAPTRAATKTEREMAAARKYLPPGTPLMEILKMA